MVLPFTLGEIAARLAADLRGEDATVDGVAPLNTAGPRQLSLCSDIRQVDALINTRAAGVLLARRASDLIERSPCSLLLVDDVRAGLARALQMFHPHQPPAAGVSSGASVHLSARIDQSARVETQAAVGEDAHVGPRSRVASGAILGKGVILGADCLIAEGAVVLEGCRLGDRVRIGPGCVIGSDGFGFVTEDGVLRPIPQVGRVEIGDDVELGANCTVDRGTMGATSIGHGTKIDNLVQVGHNVTIGQNVCIAAQTGLAGSVTVGDGAVLGGQVGVADHLTIGAGAQVGSKSGVGSHVAAKARVAGYPAVDVKTWLEGVFALRKVRRLLALMPKGQRS